MTKTYTIATYPAGTHTREFHDVTAKSWKIDKALAARKAELEAAGHQIVFVWEKK